VSKPGIAFFHAVADRVPFHAGETLYVGDRLENDVLPAAAAGFRTALIRRGPWACIHRDDPRAELETSMRIDALTELPGRIRAHDIAAH
jgi:FMN phosphatase YigB (HAD superfamily)